MKYQLALERQQKKSTLFTSYLFYSPYFNNNETVSDVFELHFYVYFRGSL